MLKKLATGVKNFFHARPAAPPAVVDEEAGHEHSFSCPCATCAAHTNKLTAMRLRVTPPNA